MSFAIQKPVVIFVRPKARGNVGAMARVMANFQVDDLRIVGDFPNQDAFQESELDWAMAAKGKALVEKIKFYPKLEDAIADLSFVLGATARPRSENSGYTRDFVDYDEFLTQEKAQQQISSWAIIIGPEDHGLNEHEHSLCSKLIAIKTNSECSSMNAAMALGCLLYHWSLIAQDEAYLKNDPKKIKDTSRKEVATLGEKEKFIDYTIQSLNETAFFKYPDQQAVQARMRRFLQNTELSQGDLLFAFEALYHLQAQIKGEFPKRDFLK